MADNYNAEIMAAQEDMQTLTDREFQRRYNATKRQYKAVITGLDQLTEVVQALQEPSPMDIDSDLIDNVRCVVDDLVRLLERMHMASYWAGEEE